MSWRCHGSPESKFKCETPRRLRMASRYKLLPTNANYVEIARICRECIRQMRREGLSYEAIVQKINTHNLKEMGRAESVTLAALKTFMSRDSVGRLNANNITIELIYNYLMDKFDILGDHVKSLMMAEWSIFNPGGRDLDANNSQARSIIAHSISSLMYKWANTSEHEISRIRSKISGKYVMLRKSVKVKSCFCWKSGGGKRGFGLVMFALCAWQNRFSDADEVQQAA